MLYMYSIPISRHLFQSGAKPFYHIKEFFYTSNGSIFKYFGVEHSLIHTVVLQNK